MNDFGKIKLLILDYQGVLVPPEHSPDDYPKEALTELLNLCKELRINLAVITAFDKLPDDFPREIIAYKSSFNKVSAANNILKKLNLNYNQVMFVADGILDLPLLQKVKISACPYDARREVKRITGILFKSTAGEGLLIELISFLKEKFERID